MTERPTHAVILGAGIGGLLAARVLVDHHERVTLVEQDALPSTPEPRRGVPQGRHVHGLLPRGEELLEELFPGLGAELRAAGAVECDVLAEVRFELADRTLKRESTGARGLQASRPFLEHHVRARVAALPGVTLRDRCRVVRPLATPRRDRVRGVLVRAHDGAPEELHADLVVACLGRGGLVPKWLRELGHPVPDEEGTEIDITYASSYVRLAPGALERDRQITIGVRELPPRALAMFAVEGERRLLTLIGHAGVRPPTDPEGFVDYARAIGPPDVATAVAGGTLLGDVAKYRYRANVRRRYERLARHPEGLVVLGDGLCSFSPVDGQGMTVAAIQATVLARCLATDPGDGLPRRFYRAAARAIDDAWTLTTIADGAMPHTPRPRAPVPLAGSLLIDPLLAAASVDARVAERVVRVLGLVDPLRSLLDPRVLTRIAVASLVARRRG